MNKSSAILSLPGSRERQIALDANHRNICKFNSDEDPGYQQVASNIVKIINDARTSQRRPVRTESSSGGNESTTFGDLNQTIQAGCANRSETTGCTNKTQQFGDRNKSSQEGNGNTTLQVVPGSIVGGSYMEMLLLGTKHLVNL